MTWIKAALIRAIKTFCQTFVAVIGTTATLGQVDWYTVLSASSLAAILSIMTSLAGLPEVTPTITDDGASDGAE